MAAEKKLQTKILNDLRSYGKYIEVFKIMRTSDNGEPDVFFTTNFTKGCFIEVKALGERPDETQLNKLRRLNDCGTQAYWCKSWPEWVMIKSDLGLCTKNVCKDII